MVDGLRLDVHNGVPYLSVSYSGCGCCADLEDVRDKDRATKFLSEREAELRSELDDVVAMLRSVSQWPE